VILLDKLKQDLELAENASAGTWSFYQEGDTEDFVVLSNGEKILDSWGDSIKDRDNCLFVVRAHTRWPATTRALIKAIEALQLLSVTLTVPAAEYVPAIADSFEIFDRAFAEIEKELG